MSDLDELLEGMAGQRIPGGCDTCNAYQTMTGTSGVHMINIHHDDCCPTYKAMPVRAS